MNTAPFIELFRSPNNYYFYEVNRNEVRQVSEATYETLKDVLEHKQTLQEACSSDAGCRRLHSAGYLSSKRPSRVEHVSTGTLMDQQRTNVRMMALQLTQNCNFRCKYCAYSGSAGDKQRTHSNTTMSLETAKKAIDFLFEHSKASPKVVLGFYGGEPLLEFKTIKECVSYAKELFKGRNLRFSITTNASLLTNEVVEFFIDNNFDILISLDGPKEIHDKNRRMAGMDAGTFDVVIKRLEEAITRYPKLKEMLSYNMVIDPKNDADCTNTLFVKYDFVSKQHTQSTLVDTRYLEGKNFEASDDFIAKAEYHKALAYMRDYRNIDSEHIMPLALTAESMLVSDIERSVACELGDVASPGGPCIPGVTRLFVDVKGRLFPCERCSEKSEVMNIGSLSQGFDYEKSRAMLNVAQIGAEECKNCWAIFRCTICATQIEDGACFSLEKRRERCEDVRREAAGFISDKIMLHEMKQIERNRRAKERDADA